MSSPLFPDDILFLQRLLASAGFYSANLDGIWGPKTDAAMTAFDARFAQIATALGTFHSRTETSLRTLHPKAQELARVSLKAIRDAGINARIISGTRTYAEQNKLFAQGRFGNPPPIVTNARGGQSNHNFGIAWDIGIFAANGAYLGNSPLYNTAGQRVMSAGIANLEWGGNWTTFIDMPHYQHLTGLAIGQVRQRFEAGQPII
jgi:peptidoglycan LD-endopeptidase CwlK